MTVTDHTHTDESDDRDDDTERQIIRAINGAGALQ